jgi:hypothetical protein
MGNFPIIFSQGSEKGQKAFWSLAEVTDDIARLRTASPIRPKSLSQEGYCRNGTTSRCLPFRTMAMSNQHWVSGHATEDATTFPKHGCSDTREQSWCYQSGLDGEGIQHGCASSYSASNVLMTLLWRNLWIRLKLAFLRAQGCLLYGLREAAAYFCELLAILTPEWSRMEDYSPSWGFAKKKSPSWEVPCSCMEVSYLTFPRLDSYACEETCRQLKNTPSTGHWTNDLVWKSYINPPIWESRSSSESRAYCHCRCV